VDVAAMTDLSSFHQRLQSLTDEIHRAATADGVEQVLLPGEREWILYHKSQVHGIDLPADVVAKLTTVASDYQLVLKSLPA
ncbi:MAG: Ldh family oxidoreductase, partial [Phycisphaerae bacterium]